MRPEVEPRDSGEAGPGKVPASPSTLRLSYSRLSRYSRCGESYRLQYVEQVPMLPSGAAIAGRVVHQIVEQMTRERWFTDAKMVETEGQRRFVQQFTDAIAEEGGVEVVRWGGRKRALRDENTGKVIKDEQGNTVLVGEDFAWFLKMGPTWLKRAGTILRADEDKGLRVVEANVERQVTVWLDEEGGVQITGIIDLMLLADEGGWPRIRDWKTGTFKDPMQLAVYAWLLENVPDDSARINTHIGELAYLRGAGAETWLLEYDLAAWKPVVPRMFRDMVKGVGAGVFALQPSSFCGSCWVRESCEYGKTLEGA